jgi:hypothetical protein
VVFLERMWQNSFAKIRVLKFVCENSNAKSLWEIRFAKIHMRKIIELYFVVSIFSRDFPFEMSDSKVDVPLVTLNTGYKMPIVLFGTYKITGQDAIDLAVDTALDAGYRGFDTAKYYKNEAEIGNALEVYCMAEETVQKVETPSKML